MSQVQILKRPVLPVIELFKNNGTDKFTFNHFTGVYDLRPRFLSVKPPFDAVGGKFEMKLTSGDASNSGMNTILNNIEEGNEIVVWLGKTDALKEKVFRGVIESIDDVEQSIDFMDVSIDGPDFGSNILKHRVVNGQYIQKRQTDGVTLDNTDNIVLLDNLTKELLQKTQNYPALDITAEAQGIIVDAAKITPPSLRMSVFEMNMEFLDDKLQELDSIGGTIHYVDPDKYFWMHKPVQFSPIPANILLTDDYSDSVALSWTFGQDHVGLLAPGLLYKRTKEHYKARLFGVGGDKETVDQAQTVTTSNTQLDANNLAQKVTAQFTILGKVNVWLSKIGTPPDDFVLEIREDHNGLPTGSVLRTYRKDKAFLNLTGGTASPHWFDINEELITQKEFWIVIKRTGTATDTYRWHHDGVGSDPSTSATSADDITWTLTAINTRTHAFRSYTEAPLLAIWSPITGYLAGTKFPREEVIRKVDIHENTVLWDLLKAEADTLNKVKYSVSGRVYAPDTLLKTGQKVRVRKQKAGRLIDDHFIIGEIEYVFTDDPSQSTGSFYHNIEAVRFA